LRGWKEETMGRQRFHVIKGPGGQGLVASITVGDNEITDTLIFPNIKIAKPTPQLFSFSVIFILKEFYYLSFEDEVAKLQIVLC
jgi:hypothetical protein